MTIASKINSLQAYTMLVLGNAVHPEFFPIRGRQKIEYGDYELENWIFEGGHALRFKACDQCITEVVTEQVEKLPQQGAVLNLPCAGEHDHEESFNDRLTYMTSIQTETLSDHLYLSTYNELLEHGRMCEGLMTVWTDDLDRPNLSMIDLQRYNDQIHIQAYHCRSDCGLVLRTQTIFQVNEE